MKSTVPKLILALLALFSVIASGPANAATIAISGRITNGIQPPPNDPFLAGSIGWTLHAYWFTVTAPTTVTYTWCETNGPGGNFGTGIGSTIWPNADALADLDNPVLPLSGAFLGENPIGTFCSVGTYLLAPGRYVFDVHVFGGGYDGAGGLESQPIIWSDKDFVWFDYTGTIEGENIRLDSIWKGQINDTWLKTNVPEPGMPVLCLIGAWLTMVLRKRAKGVACASALSVAFLTSVKAEEGVLRWQSQQGMGYELERSADLGHGVRWIPIPAASYYGTGGEMWHRCFELDTPTQPLSGTAALRQIVPQRNLFISARKDGSAVLSWTQQGVGVAAFIGPPGANTTQAAAAVAPYFDLRATPGVAWSGTTNPLRTGFAYLGPMGTPAFKLQIFAWGDYRPTPPIPSPPVLTVEQAAELAWFQSQVSAIRAGLTPNSTNS